ncbi:MAG: hypothetical protein AAB510_03420 [Patescibacteria group bacterium]
MDQQQNNKKKGDIVQTYAEDIVKVFETGQVGAGIKEMLHSEEEQEKVRNNLSPQSTKNRAFMFLGVFLLAISFGTLIFFLSRDYTPSVVATQQFTPLIFNDKVALVDIADLKKDSIAPKVLKDVDTSKLKDGGVVGIYLTLKKSPVYLRNFIEIIEGDVVFPDKTFVEENFLLGMVKNTENDVFMLIKMRSVADIFPSMRLWENKMFEDLHSFFGVDLSSVTKDLLTKDFEDGIIENKNARMLYDVEGKIVMMYVFADNNSLIITNTREAAREIILRLATSTLKK